MFTLYSKLMEHRASLAVFNTIWWRTLIVVYFFGTTLYNADRYLDGFHGSFAQLVMWPVLRVVVEQHVEGIQIVAPRHRRPMKSKVVGEFINEEERSFIAVASQQNRTVLELSAMQEHFRFARQERSVDDREERKLDDSARHPLLVDDERGRLRAKAGGHFGHVGRAWTVEVVEGELEGPSQRLRLAGGRPRHVRRAALHHGAPELRAVTRKQKTIV